MLRRHNGERFFDIRTSKNGPNLVCVVHFDLNKCFEPQHRALFHLATWLRTRRFLLFDPPDPQIIGKTQCFATFLTFRPPVSSFFLLFLFLSSTLSLFYSFSLLLFLSSTLLSSSLLYSSLFFSSLLFSLLLFSSL